jgi:predicted MFS family arabinose efflux permease
MARLDRDLRLLFVAIFLFAAGYGLFYQILYVYALSLGASRFTIGAMNAIVVVCTAAGLVPGAWAASRFRLKPVIAWVWWLLVPCGVIYALAPTWQWLIPGLVFFGASNANNPAFKAYIVLRSEPQRVARHMTLVLAAYPLGLILAPAAGGLIADTYGMRAVFVISTVIFALSATTASLLHDTPYHAPGEPLHLGSLRHNRAFRRLLAFFLVGFLAAYLAQPFLTPFMAQVHHLNYGQLGLYASIGAIGAALLGPAMGRVADLYSPRLAAGGVLVFLLVGAVLFMGGNNPAVWGLAFICYGSFDALRAVASGIVGKSFGTVPLAWGFAIFDTVMAAPMAAGSLLGGLLYRQSYYLPFVGVVVLTAALLVALLLWPRLGPLPSTVSRRDDAGVMTDRSATTGAGG